MILHSSRYPRDRPADLSKPNLLFLHGMGGNGSLWRPIAAHLEDQANLLCPDQRGHGASLVHAPTSPLDFSPLAYAGDVEETCAALHFTPAWVIGHSMGVRTACGYANLSPSSVIGLILVDLGLTGEAGGGIGNALSVFLRDLPTSFENRETARVFLRDRCPDPSIAQYLLAVSKLDRATGRLEFPFDPDALLMTIEASRGVEIGGWLEKYVRESGRPVYVLRGSESRVYRKAEFEADRDRFADSPMIEFVEVAGAGHGLPFEKRAEFTSFIRARCGLTAPKN